MCAAGGAFKMWKDAIIFFVTFVGLAQAVCPAPGGNCGRTLTLPPQEYIASPCYPDNYPNSQSCMWNLTTTNSSYYYTQIVLTSFDVEAWHDYVKFDGPENFIIFYNKTEDNVIITGYPSGRVAANLVTDNDRSFKGFNASVVAVSENNLLDQYSTYRNDSLVQVLDSPMYLSSSQNTPGAGLAVMFMNIPNTTDSPIEVWKDYAGIITNSTRINTYDISPTGFTANWTEIEGTESYTLTIFDSRGVTLRREENLNALNFSADGLPSGSRFNVSITAANKLGNSVTFSANAETEVADPTNLVANQITQTSMILQWNGVNGSTNYTVNVTDRTSTYYRLQSTSLSINGLKPGVMYEVEVVATFEVGESTKVSAVFSTVPGNVTLQVRNSSTTTTSITVYWSLVPGASNYSVVVLENGAAIKNISTSLDSVIIVGLNPGKTYAFEVTAVNTAGRSFPSSVDATTDLIPESATVWAEDETSTSFKVRWSNIPGAISYNLSVIESGNVAHSKSLGKVLEYDVKNLPSGTEFTLKLFVFGPEGVKVLTSNITYSTVVVTVPNVRVTSQEQTSFTVRWTKVIGAIRYEINVTGNVKDIRNDTVEDFYIVNGLDYGTTYQVSIYAVFPVGIGGKKTLNEPTVPGNVTNITVGGNDTNANLKWNAARGAESYILDITGGGTKNTKETTENRTNIPVLPGTKYSITLRARNRAGTSNASKEFTSALYPPANFEIVGVTKNQFVLQWKKLTPQPDSCHYRYKCDPGPTTDYFPCDRESVTVANLKSSTLYTCEIYAFTPYKNGVKVNKSATTAESFCPEKNPCLNGGSCDEGLEKCHCTEAYTGKTCEKVFDWCNTTICAPEHASCENNVTLLRAVCKCNEHFVGDPKVRCQAYCEQQTVMNKTLQFNFTYADGTAFSTEQCTEDGNGRSLASAVCRTKISTDGKIETEFQSIVIVACKLTISNVTIQIDPTSSNVTSKELETQSAQLQVLTSGEVEEEDVKKVAQYMEDIASISESNKEVVTEDVLIGMVNTADNLIQTDSIELDDAPPQPVTQSPGQTEKPPETPLEREKKIKQKILRSLTTLAEQVQIANDTNEIVIETPSIVVKVVNEEAKSDGTTEDVPFEPFIATGDAEDGKATNYTKPLSIKIPGSAIEEAKKGGKKIRISFFLHKDASLFPSDTRNPPGMIIAASLGEGVSLPDLKDDIEFQYAKIDRNAGVEKGNKFNDALVTYECAFWDFNLTDWSNEGCCLDPYNITKCRCDHLTNFALLVSDKDIPANIGLEVMSSVGLVLSMLGLLLTIVIHCLKDEIRKRRPAQILMHICGNLFFSYLVFLIGVDSTENNMACVAIAALLQFLFLASWCWMTVYAYDMYRSFVLVFNTSKSRYLTKCTVFAYGVPLLIVIIDAAIAVGYVDAHIKPLGVCDNEDGYDHLYGIMPFNSSYVAGNMCWLQGYSLYFGFLLPVGLMLAFNLFVYVMVLKTLSQRKKTVQSSAKKTGMKDNFLISITLSASTGLTWAVGYVMLLSDNESFLLVTSWIFTTLNVVQGVVIFITTCVRHENMRKIWLTPILRCCSRATNRIRLLSPRRSEFEVTSTTGPASSGFLSTSDSAATRDTAVKSISAKEISESTF